MKRDSLHFLPYIAPPTTALLYIPYQFLPNNTRIPIAMLISFLFVLSGTLIVGKAVKNTVLALFAVFSSWFVWVCIWQVQPTAVLFLITALLYAAITKRKHSLTGILCALFVIKPQYLIIVPFVYLLVERSPGFVRTFLVSCLILLTANLIISGPHMLFFDYPKLLSFTDNPTYGNRWYEMYSVQQLVYRFSRAFTDSIIPPLVAGAIFYLFGLYTINKRIADKYPLEEIFPLIIVVALTSAYHVLPQDMALLAIPVVLSSGVNINNNQAKRAYKFLALQLLGYITTASYLANFYTLLVLAVFRKSSREN